MTGEQTPNRREVDLCAEAQQAVNEAALALQRAIAHRDSLLTGIVAAAGISQGTVVELRGSKLILEVPIHTNGNG